MFGEIVDIPMMVVGASEGTGGSGSGAADDIDPASFLISLSPELRAEVRKYSFPDRINMFPKCLKKKIYL